MRLFRALPPASGVLFACFCAFPQSVISVHSGVVHFVEGSVFIDDQPVDQKLGTFANVKQASTLRTEKGRAEILLSPGVFLRVDQNSSVRMISTAITDTQVEFLKGSVIVDTLEGSADAPVTVTYKDCKVRFPKQGIYRFDSEPAALLQVYNGQAEIAHDGKSSAIDTSHLFFFAASTETKKFDDGTDDEFYAWARDRSETIASENQLAAQTAKDPADMDNGQAVPLYPNLGLGASSSVPWGPTYAPLGGIYSMGSTFFDPYVPFGAGSWGAYPLFVPVYVPRYYYRNHSRWPTTPSHPTWTPARIGSSAFRPASPMIVPHTVPAAIGTVRPGSSRPASIGAPHPAVSVGVHAIGHR